ncbi:Thermophilic serine proteinase [Tetrabaena socialis]|uniref:Thermophilic serine proteinase n=1 Tax=Tetrabaena socialis TaxID=47790 RepID=A0A2J8A7Z8_9CHLO|nr:Thermophilic serine proteinase [Tetrabaena socialis]|eukprot:PNH08638.1 Thermophilic serine proteinase [Tetrabaena socialis]
MLVVFPLTLAEPGMAARHRWLYWGLLLLLVLGLSCVAIVLLAVYQTTGSTPKPDEQEIKTHGTHDPTTASHAPITHPTRYQDNPISLVRLTDADTTVKELGCCAATKDDPIRLRLMVHLTDANATVAMLLPLLSGFFNSSKLPSSGLELLDFDDLGIMREVKSRLCEQHADILDLMLDDFLVMSKAQPDKNDVATAATAATGPAGHDSSQQQSGAADPEEAKQWHLEAIGAASAWAITRGLPDVIVAVVDNGVDLYHPDIRPNIWINQREMDGKAGIDDDDNGGNARHVLPSPNGHASTQDSISPVSSTCTASPSAFVPVTDSVPVSGVGQSPDRLCIPGFEARCGGDPNPFPAPSGTYDGLNNRDHGTHVAGLVGAVRGNGMGGSGMAPNVKIMALKALDNMGDVYASNVMVAYDYALRMGAHVVSCSFGPKYPILQPNSEQLAAAAQEVRLYEQAVRPMAQKGVLLVASAGNELTNLDVVRDVNMSYLPCTLDLPNVVCVAASNSDNQIYSELGRDNKPKGTNTGPTTVHIAAPGSDIYSTVLGSNATGAYGYKTGSSMAAAILSGAAALVLSVLGAADGNFYQAARARSLLLETGDPRPGLPVITGRTLNVGRAVQAAAEHNRMVLQPMAVDVAVQSSVLLRGLTDSYFHLPPATAAAIAAAAASDSTATGPATTNGSVAAVSPVAAGPSSLLGLLPFGGSVRNASTCFSSFKYVGEDVMVAVRGHLKLPEAGQYGVRLATASPLARLAVTVGQRQLIWQAVTGGVREAVLLAPQPGWYVFELLYANSAQSLELSWALPSSPHTFDSLPDGYLGTGSMTLSTAPAHAPASLPVPGAVPSGFQVLWQPVMQGSTNGSWDGGFLATLDAKRFYPYSSIVEDVSYTSSGALAGALAGARAGGGGSTSMTAAGGALYGLALAHIRAPAAPEQLLQFQVTCSFCSLYVGDMLVLEVLDPANPATGPLKPHLSSCLTLGPTASTPGPVPQSAPAAGARLTTATYPLQLRFATPNASVSTLVLQWAPCNSPLADFAPLAPLLAGGLWYREPAPQPAAAAGGGNGTTVPAAATSTPPPPSMQCDAWDSSAIVIPIPGTVVALPRPEEVAPAYSFRLPSPNTSGLTSCQYWPICSRRPSGSNLTFQIADLYPALRRSSEPLYVRCWAWWSSSFRGGLLAVWSSDSLYTAVYVAGQRVGAGRDRRECAGNMAQTSCYQNYRLAAYQVFYSVAYNSQLIANRQPLAPNTTSLAGGYRQLLVLEWHGVKSFAQLAVMDGSVDSEQSNATLLVANMFAPTA